MRPEGSGDAPLTGSGALEQRLQAIRRDGADRPPLAPGLAKPEYVPPSMRDYGVGVQILRALGLSKLRLITHHQRGLPGLDAFGLEVAEYVAPPA
jgi:GTP cyclohydrolase II